jgi:hypothetical protein
MIQVSPEQVRRIAGEILAGPEFSDRPTWTQLVLERVVHWLGSLVRWSAQNPDLSFALSIVLGVIVVVLVVHIVYTVVKEFVSLRTPGRAGPSRQVPQALEGVGQDCSDALQLARTALESGDLYRALWIAHRALLAVLDQVGRIKFNQWKTNSDYLRECRDGDVEARTLRELTAAYERVIYAHTEFDRVETVKLLARVEALAAEAGR